MNADLIAISKLIIGQSADPDGVALAAFAKAFEYANTRSLLLDLWDPQRASTAFYQFLFNNIKFKGLKKSAAIRQAKIDMISLSDLNKPFFWSPFILYGNP